MSKLNALEKLKALQAEKRSSTGSQAPPDPGVASRPPSFVGAGAAHPPPGRASSGMWGGAGAAADLSSRPPPQRPPAAAAARVPQPPPKHSAASAHVETDAYMQRFEDALRLMGLQDDPAGEVMDSVRPSGQGHTRERYGGPPELPGPAANRPGPGPAGRASPGGRPSVAPGPAAAAARPLGGDRAGPSRPSGGVSRTSSGIGRAGSGVGAGGAAGAVTDDEPFPSAAPGWAEGPLDPAGALIELSERPLMCGCANWSLREAYVGGSDHAVYVLDLDTGAKKRQLYNRTYGHSEWVTGVAAMEDGRVASVGMDGKLMVWDRGVVRASSVEAHPGSVSAVQVDRSSGRLVTCGYEKLVKVWEAGRAPRAPSEVCALRGHPAPVMCLKAQPNTGIFASGDRSGNVAVWDLVQGTCSRMHKAAHGGHVTCLTWGGAASSEYLGPTTYLTGGQDGVLKVWDSRAPSAQLSLDLHVNDKGRGAVGFAVAVPGTGTVATAGADGMVCILDPRGGFETLQVARLTNFPYELKAVGPHVLAGCGDGSVHVIDTAHGSTRYALGANRAAVRYMAASEDTLLCAGDDGTSTLYRFR